MTAWELARKMANEVETDHKYKTNREKRQLAAKRIWEYNEIRGLKGSRAIPMWVIWLAVQLIYWWFFTGKGKHEQKNR